MTSVNERNIHSSENKKKRLFWFFIIVGVLLVCLGSFFIWRACNNNQQNISVSGEPFSSEQSSVSVTISDNFTQIETEEDQESGKSGIILPTECSENYFDGKVEINIFVEPNEMGQYVIEETQTTLDIRNKTLEEEISHRVEELNQLEIEVIEVNATLEETAVFVFDEINYIKAVNVVTDLLNKRISGPVSISKSFDECILYVDENTDTLDLYIKMESLLWHLYMCRIYSGISEQETPVLIKVVHINTEEILLEFTLEQNTSLNISAEEWEALLIKEL